MFDYEIKQTSADTLTVKIASDLVQDLIIVLTTIAEMSRVIRSKARFIEAGERARDPADVARRRAAFDTKSREVLARYQEELKTGLSPAETLQATRKKLSLGYGEIKIYLTQGRRLLKAGKTIVKAIERPEKVIDKQRRVLYTAPNSISRRISL